MARSVDYLSNAYHVYYIDGTEMQDEFDWDDFMSNLKSLLTNTLPSLDECENWDGRETKIFLENSFCEAGVSEYCGLVSVSFRWHQNAEYQTEPLFENWFDKMQPKIDEIMKTNFSSLNKIGTFSNGESLYEQAS
ncbi:MAG: hypothetical protein MI743_19375 [Sneathiellales bacterium]|nr:hypothetical protein [Sneathiellales bacterium]